MLLLQPGQTCSHICHGVDVTPPEERTVRSQFTCRKQEAACLRVQLNGSSGSNNGGNIKRNRWLSAPCAS